MDLTTAEHMANIINACFSAETLQAVAGEMGEAIQPGEDIFQAMIRAGRAADIETSVMLVVAHLDGPSPVVERSLQFLRHDRRRSNQHG